jgi:dihydroxyacetone kinase-like protein
MKKLINDPFAVVDEMIDGYVAAHGDLVKRAAGGAGRAVVSVDAPIAGKVGVIIGGGSGHEPAFMGYVGEGSADGCPVGNVFASPSPDPILVATKAVNGGAGVIYSYGNYSGDVMNFDMAAEMAATDDIEVRTILVTDDVASAPKGKEDERRGIAGGFFVFKAIAARAAEMASLAEVEASARKANDRTRTMGVALSACTVPAAGRATFSLEDNEMEIGLGIHGEPGMRRGSIETADNVSNALLDAILADMPLKKGDRVGVLINGLGATPAMELYIIFRQVAKRLAELGVTIHRSYVGEYVTSLEMAGASITLIHLDDELARLIDAPARTPMFVQN